MVLISTDLFIDHFTFRSHQFSAWLTASMISYELISTHFVRKTLTELSDSRMYLSHAILIDENLFPLKVPEYAKIISEILGSYRGMFLVYILIVQSDWPFAKIVRMI